MIAKTSKHWPPIKPVQFTLLGIFVITWLILIVGHSYANQLTNRSVAIQTAFTNATTSHTFSFAVSTTNSIGSIAFLYCDNSPLPNDPCNPPSGLALNNAILSSEQGDNGFSLQSNAGNRLVIGRTAVPTIPGQDTYSFSDIVNPSVAQTYFVRISTYASSDGSGTAIDQGSVAFSLSNGLAVDAYVPPFLALCVGASVAIDCSTTSGSGTNLGTLSPTKASIGTTQLAAATNDPTGYTLSVLGTTMTSGNNTIPALTAPTVSAPGTGQFGINLRANTNPQGGQEPAGGGSASPTAAYNQSNLFTFNSGDTIATASTSTNYNQFTISYLTNIPFGQAPGVYNTTMTFVALASF